MLLEHDSGVATSQPVSNLEATTSRRARSFFDTFPRELRDCVYDLLYQDVEVVDGLEYHARSCIVELRLVSRQFKSEYDERMPVICYNHQLGVNDTLDCELGEPIRVPRTRYAAHTTSLTINLLACDEHCWYHDGSEECHSYSMIQHHAAWIEKLLQNLPHLQSIRVTVKAKSCVRDTLNAAQFLTDRIPKISELEILR